MPSFLTTLHPGESLDLTGVSVEAVTFERVTKSGVTVRVIPRDPNVVLRPAGRMVDGKLRLTESARSLQFGS